MPPKTLPGGLKCENNVRFFCYDTGYPQPHPHNFKQSWSDKTLRNWKQQQRHLMNVNEPLTKLARMSRCWKWLKKNKTSCDGNGECRGRNSLGVEGWILFRKTSDRMKRLKLFPSLLQSRFVGIPKGCLSKLHKVYANMNVDFQMSFEATKPSAARF